MSSLQPMMERMGVPVIDEASADTLLAGDGQSWLLLFPGEPAQRAEAIDVAVVYPELLKAFSGRLLGAVVAAKSERALGQRFGVDMFPSLALIRGGATIGVISRIRDWSYYLEKIAAFLDPQAQLTAKGAGPRVEFTYSKGGQM